MYQPNQPYSHLSINRSLTLLFVFVIFCSNLNAQTTNDATLTNKVNSANDSLDNFLTLPNDSIDRIGRQVNLVIQNTSDSLATLQNQFINKFGNDSLNKVIPFKKLTSHTNQLFAKNHLPDAKASVPMVKAPVHAELNFSIEDKLADQNPIKKKWIEMPFGRAKSIKQAIDTGNYESVEKFTEQKIAEQFTELNQLQSGKNDLPTADIAKLQEIEWDPQKINASQKVSELLAQNADKIEGAFAKVDKLKKKYSKVNLLNSDGPVLEPIESTPLKRWVYGLGLQGAWQNQLNLSIAPVLGYKINKKWTAGISGVMNLSINVKDSFAIYSNKEFAFRIYSQYEFYKNIFVHAEFEQPYKLIEKIRESAKERLIPQNPKGWVGLGLNYKIYKSLRGQTQLLYNMIASEQTIMDSRWSVRVVLSINR